ncbi:MAG: hypothetical protein JNL38_37030 [Myxococcales bacterium]|nr:hypothetical protein [Myxococcales bacterium]
MSDLDNQRAMKVHLSPIDVGRRTLRVITLRPGTTARFSTNWFHETWHVLTSPAGAHVLGRLLWGLSFQRKPGTLVLLDRPHLVTTPFDGDAADRVVFAPSELTHVDAPTLRALKERLARPTTTTTARWHTFGLPAALEDHARRRWSAHRWREHLDLARRDRVRHLAGFIVHTAPLLVMRAHATSVFAMQDTFDTSYHFMADTHSRGCRAEGEVQVFRDFDAKVSAARVARREVLGEGRAIDCDEVRWAVQRRADVGADRLRRARGAT